jgi:hypothetical protein
MIPMGILASSGSTTTPPADISTWVIDFINEVYTQDGGSVAIATIIDQPSKVDATDGLEILEDNDVDGVIVILGDLLTDILVMDWTMVIEWKTVDEDFALCLIYIDEDVDGHSLIVEPIFFGTDRVLIQETGFIIRSVTPNGSIAAGNHKIALTRQQGLLSASLDGGTVVTTSTVYSYPAQGNAPNRAGFGGPVGDFSFNNCFIRRVDLMPAVDNGDLPGLSA